MTSVKKRIKYIAVFSSICLIFLFIASPFLLIWGANTTYIKEQISDYIYQESDIRVHSSEFALKLFPKPGIKLNNISIQPDSRTAIDMNSIRINLDLSRLMQGKINLGEIIITQPQIRLPVFKIKSADSKNSFSFMQFFKILDKGFALLPENQPGLDITIQDAKTDYFERLDASVTVNKNEKSIYINTTIKDFSFSQILSIHPDLKKHLNIDTLSVKEIQLNTQLTQTNSITGECLLSQASITAENQKKLFKTDAMALTFSISETSQLIKMEQMKMDYPGGALGVEFSNTPEQKISKLSFSGRDILVNQAREMSLTLFKDLYVPQTLFDILLDGRVPEIEVSLKSSSIDTLISGNNLELSGLIQDGKVHIPNTPLIVSGIEGSAAIKNGVLDISTNQGTLNSSSIEKGTLMVDLLNYEDVPFKGEFNLDAALSTLPETLISLLPGTLISKELSKVHAVKGQCKATLNLELKSGAQDVRVQVRTKNFSVQGQYDRIPGNIVLNTISMEYKPNQITLNNVSGEINDTVVTNLFTTIGLGRTSYINVHKGSAIIELQSTIPWLMSYPETRKIIAPVENGSGKLVLSSISLSGPVKKFKSWKYNISGNMDNISLTTTKNRQQIQNLTCNYEASNKEIHLEDIQASVHALDLLESYLPQKNLDSIRLPFNIKEAQLKASDTASFFKGVFNFSNGPRLKIALKGDTFDELKLNTVEIKDGDNSNAQISFNTEENKPVFDFKGRLITKTLYKLLKPKSFLRNKLFAITEGQPVSVYTDAQGILNIITKNIDVNSFISSNRKNRSFLNTRMLTEGLINFKAEKLKIKKLNFTNVESKMSFSDNHSYIRIKKANLCDLNIGGYLNIKDKKVYANFPLKAENQENIQSLLSCLFNENKFMDGPYSFSCNLSTNDVELKTIAAKFNGDFILKSTQGRIYRWTLLSRILSILNVSSVFKGKVPDITQKGFAYKAMIIEAQIKDSIIHLTNAVIDGEDMTMAFSGTIDPINDKINLTCLVAPFKTVDLIVEKIPVINTILGGKLVSVPVKAEGKLFDPTVIPLHPSAVGSGIINMMSRILKAPVSLWDKISKDDDTPPEK